MGCVLQFVPRRARTKAGSPSLSIAAIVGADGSRSVREPERLDAGIKLSLTLIVYFNLFHTYLYDFVIFKLAYN